MGFSIRYLGGVLMNDIKPGAIGVMVTDNSRPAVLWRCNSIFPDGSGFFHQLGANWADPVLVDVRLFWPLIDAEHAPL